jgi:hypothetical protein
MRPVAGARLTALRIEQCVAQPMGSLPAAIIIASRQMRVDTTRKASDQKEEHMRSLWALFMAGFLAGCGGASDRSDESDKAASPAAVVEDATNLAAEKSGCDLLTDAEVGQATGTMITRHEEAGLNGCRWRAQGGAKLMLDVYTGSSLSSATCDGQKFLGTGREEPVAGLGDSALWKTSRSLVVCAARAVIRLNLDNSARTVPEDKEAMITLARSVLGRL